MQKHIVSFDDFSKLDLRVGKVVEVEDVEGSEKLYRMSVDLGQEYRMRTIYVGLKSWYKKSALKGKNFIFVSNLTPRKMPGGESQGMMLAICETDEKPLLLPAPNSAIPGQLLQ